MTKLKNNPSIPKMTVFHFISMMTRNFSFISFAILLGWLTRSLVLKQFVDSFTWWTNIEILILILLFTYTYSIIKRKKTSQLENTYRIRSLVYALLSTTILVFIMTPKNLSNWFVVGLISASIPPVFFQFKELIVDCKILLDIAKNSKDSTKEIISDISQKKIQKERDENENKK